MRVDTPELLLMICKTPLKDLILLHLDSFDLETLVLKHCPSLECLSLRNNRLAYIDESIKECKCLWSLNLASNKISSLEHLRKFEVLGYLNVSGNVLSYENLLVLREIHIIHFVLEDAQRENAEQEKLNLIHLLPNTWILNGRFVTQAERKEAENRASSSIQSLVQIFSNEQFRNCPFLLGNGHKPSAFALLKGLGDDHCLFNGGGEPKGKTERPTCSSKADGFMKMISRQPVIGPARDMFRLQYLVSFHDTEALQYNTNLAHQIYRKPSSSLPPMPLLHLDAIQRLPARLRLDIIVLLVVKTQVSVPSKILYDALGILCLGYLSFDQIQELCHLPQYAIAALALYGREWGTTIVARQTNTSMENDLIAGLDGIIHGRPAASSSDEDKNAGRSLLTRHAALLLSRAPSCPPLTTGPTSTLLQREYDAIFSLLRRAGLANTDLFGPLIETGGQRDITPWRFGASSPRTDVGKLSWNTRSPMRNYLKPWSWNGLEEQHGEDQDEQEARHQQYETGYDGIHVTSAVRREGNTGRCKTAPSGDEFSVDTLDKVSPDSTELLPSPLRRQVISANPIQGFSQDASWNLNFVLAPSFSEEMQNPQWGCLNLAPPAAIKKQNDSIILPLTRQSCISPASSAASLRAGSEVASVWQSDGVVDSLQVVHGNQVTSAPASPSSSRRRSRQKRQQPPIAPYSRRESLQDKVYQRWLLQRRQETAWQELQREMGSFRTINQYGSRASARSPICSDMNDIRRLVKARKAALETSRTEEVGEEENVFKLTAVPPSSYIDIDSHRVGGEVEDDDTLTVSDVAHHHCDHQQIKQCRITGHSRHDEENFLLESQVPVEATIQRGPPSSVAVKAWYAVPAKALSVIYSPVDLISSAIEQPRVHRMWSEALLFPSKDIVNGSLKRRVKRQQVPLPVSREDGTRPSKLTLIWAEKDDEEHDYPSVQEVNENDKVDSDEKEAKAEAPATLSIQTFGSTVPPSSFLLNKESANINYHSLNQEEQMTINMSSQRRRRVSKARNKSPVVSIGLQQGVLGSNAVFSQRQKQAGIAIVPPKVSC